MVKHSSKPVSGRAWKQKKECKTSGVIAVKAVKSSFEKKMQLKQQKQNCKELASQILTERSEKLEARRKQEESNKKRREENERKCEIVQTISIVNAINKLGGSTLNCMILMPITAKFSKNC
eukprot:sb/3476103/